MKYVQSRYQNCLSHCFDSLIRLLYFLSGSLFILWILEVEVRSEFTYVAVITSLIILAYDLLKFSKGAVTLEFHHAGIRVRDHHLVTDIKAEHYLGYTVSKVAPFPIVLTDRAHGKTRIQYFSFSKSQRIEIFNLLNQYKPTVSIVVQGE